MANRSSLGKQLTKDRYYLRAKKNVVYAYIWFFFGGAVGAHRFYLGRWKSGLALLFVMQILLLVMFSGTGPGVTIVFVLLILAVELIFVAFLTKWTNQKIKRDLDLEMF
ncbi:MAG: NINE protein [Alphaproteobacteria bacterium]